MKRLNFHNWWLRSISHWIQDTMKNKKYYIVGTICILSIFERKSFTLSVDVLHWTVILSSFQWIPLIWLDIKYIVKKPSLSYQCFILLLLYEISVGPVRVYPWYYYHLMTMYTTRIWCIENQSFPKSSLTTPKGTTI